MTATPLLPGFYPDPSICRAGDDLYLVNSSFEYVPGVPLFHSRDLLHWTQLGHVLDRPSQLRLTPGLAGASGGIFAPTIRHHDGTFYLITTNVAEAGRGHLIVRTQDPAGPWSDPVYTAGATGIDPDLAWDTAGTCYLTWCAPTRGIFQATVDPGTGELRSAPRLLWPGTGLADTEGPHLYRRADWWYLVVAEGGTGRGHGVSVARSRRPTGPFEPHSDNPVFSHRSTGHPVQHTGHADLVELADGRWAMVYLGVRPRGAFPGFHVNGRETFLAAVDWRDDWPVVVEDQFTVPPTPTAFVDDFTGPDLHPRWVSPAGHEDLRCVRARDLDWQVEATIDGGDARLVVRLDDAHWAGLERRGAELTVRMVIGPLDQVLATRSGLAARVPLVIRAVGNAEQYSRGGPDRIELGYLVDAHFERLSTVDGRYLSTEVAGGFTGRMIGVQALGEAVVTRFGYSPGVL